MDGDLHGVNGEEPPRRGSHGQTSCGGERNAGHGLEGGQRGEREHGHHDRPETMRVNGAHRERDHASDGGRHAPLGQEAGSQRAAGVTAFDRVGMVTRLDRRSDPPLVRSEGEELGGPGQRVDHLSRESSRELGQLLVTVPSPGQHRGNHQCHGERQPESQRRPREDEAHDDGAERPRSHGDRRRQPGP